MHEKGREGDYLFGITKEKLKREPKDGDHKEWGRSNASSPLINQ